MTAKTEEDWFLRGGPRPRPDGSEKTGNSVDLAFCQNCGRINFTGEAECAHCGASLAGGCPAGEHCGDDDGEVLRDWTVAMSRTRSVQQTAKVRVKARSEEEAVDLIEDRAEDEAENWAWKDIDDTEEFEDVEAVEAEAAT